MITNKDLSNVYNATGETIPAKIEKTIVKECCDEIVLNYLKTNKVPGNTIYECSKLVSFGTEYQKNTYVILPSSTNKNILLGKIEKILACRMAMFSIKRQCVNIITILTFLWSMNFSSAM